jgi:hypothetical protein
MKIEININAGSKNRSGPRKFLDFFPSFRATLNKEFCIIRSLLFSPLGVATNQFIN